MASPRNGKSSSDKKTLSDQKLIASSSPTKENDDQSVALAFHLQEKEEQEERKRNSDIKKDKDFAFALQLQLKTPTSISTTIQPRGYGSFFHSITSGFLNSLLNQEEQLAAHSELLSELIFSAHSPSSAPEIKEVDPKGLTPVKFFQQSFDDSAYSIGSHYIVTTLNSEGVGCIVKEKKWS